MSLSLGDIAPNFTADTTHGMINFYEWMDDSWTILLSHPKDFTPVCTTELLWIAKNNQCFNSRNIKVISLSVDKLIQHSKWLDDIKSNYDIEVRHPIISDKNMRIAKLYSMINTSSKLRSSNTQTPSTARSVYIISPEKKVISILNYPVNTGRSFTEVLRLLDSLHLTFNNDIATPVNWNLGDKLVVAKRDSETEKMLGHPSEVDYEINDYLDNNVNNNKIAC